MSGTSQTLARSVERARAAAIALHLRDSENLAPAEIAERLGVSASTVRSYLSDPDGSKSRSRREGYRGVCMHCGIRKTSGSGPTRSRTLCVPCARELERLWPPERLLVSARDWLDAYGVAPNSTDWDRTRARARGGEALARLGGGAWPYAATVFQHFSSWSAFLDAAGVLTKGPLNQP